jgi:hypothetical protein
LNNCPFFEVVDACLIQSIPHLREKEITDRIVFEKGKVSFGE